MTAPFVIKEIDVIKEIAKNYHVKSDFNRT